jgi:hypothetical protein
MRISALWLALFLLFACPAPGQNNGFPLVNSVDPKSGKPGAVLTAQGVRLGGDSVAGLFLTDGTIDVAAEIVEQTATSIKFEIPRTVKPGRYALMVLTSGPEGRYIEEPVKITIEPETAH